ncbi:MAG TPA: IPT/TIG domain-containing protein, partial [Chryseosolibacter sp.]
IMITACDDDENTSTEVTLLSFGPVGVKHGETIKFIGTNLDNVSAIVLQPGIEVSSASFSSQSPGLIELVVPQAAETGKLMLKTPAGDIETKTVLDLEVPVEITAMSGEVKPGQNLTITGNFLNWVEQVEFADGLVVTEFVSQSLNELVVTVPMEAESGFVTFFTTGTEPLKFSSAERLTVSLPSVTELNPASVEHTKNLTLTGTNLDLVTSIVFSGGTEVSTFVEKTENKIVVTVPATALKGKLTLKQASPVSVTTTGELLITLPAATDLQPKPAAPGTDNITITGTNLNLVAKLTFTGKNGPIEILAKDFTTHSAQTIVFALPADADNGSVSYTTVHNYSSPLGVSIAIPGAGPPPLDYYIYKDGLQNGWSEWGGWGHTTKDFNSTDEVFAGTKAIKMTFNDQYGAVQIGSPSATVFSGYTKLTFRVYAPAAQNLIVQLNDAADKYLSIPQGWSLVEVNISELAGNTNVTELRIKNNNANLPVTLYFDELGLKL